MTEGKEKKSIFKKWWFWLIIFIVIVGVAFGGDSNDSKVEQEDGRKIEKKTNANEIDEKTKEEERIKQELEKKAKEEELRMKKEQEEKAKAEQAKKEEEERKLLEQQKQDKVESIGMKPEQFKNNFNKISNEVQTGFNINQLVIDEGAVQNTFKYQINDNVGIIGSVNKRTGLVREITMVAQGDGTEQSGIDMLLAMGTLIRASDLKMTPEESGNILNKLIGEDFNINDYEASTVRNGIEYSIMTSSELGIWFIISNANDN